MAGVSAYFAAVKCEENIGCKNATLVLPLRACFFIRLFQFIKLN